MTISEKSAYLKGLAEGMKLDTEKAEGKLIAYLIDLVGEIATAVEVLDDETTTMADYIDELDKDLGELEEYVFDYNEDEDDFDFDDDDDDEYEFGEYDECDGECEGCHGCEDFADDEPEVYDVDAEGMRCLMCDHCGDTICYDETLKAEDIICPACGKHAVSEDKE